MTIPVASLRARIRAGETVIGTFVKTPAPHIVEVLGLSGLDFVVADQEHAPINAAALDLMVMAGRGVALPIIVRVPANEATAIASPLDMGAAGLVVPHIRSAEAAQAVLDAAKFSRGRRGFSPSPRAAGYGTEGHADFRRRSDAESIFLAQIEDRAALDNIKAIAAIDDIDALCVGPADLALSLGCEPADAALAEAIRAVLAAGKRHGKPVGIFLGRGDQMAAYAAMGMSVFICGSDQSLMMAGARQLSQAAAQLRTA